METHNVEKFCYSFDHSGDETKRCLVVMLTECVSDELLVVHLLRKLSCFWSTPVGIGVNREQPGNARERVVCFLLIISVDAFTSVFRDSN